MDVVMPSRSIRYSSAGGKLGGHTTGFGVALTGIPSREQQVLIADTRKADDAITRLQNELRNQIDARNILLAKLFRSGMNLKLVKEITGYKQSYSKLKQDVDHGRALLGED
jgi:hypothetical protein